MKRICVYILLLAASLGLLTSCEKQKDETRMREIFGVVEAYEQTDAGLVLTIVEDKTGKSVRVVIHEGTLFSDDLKNKICQMQEIGLHIEVASEYSPWNFDGLYPATVIWYRSDPPEETLQNAA